MSTVPRASLESNRKRGRSCADLPMDFDEEGDFADQSHLTDIDMEEDAQILEILLRHLPSCMNAADIEQLMQDIPVQPPNWSLQSSKTPRVTRSSTQSTTSEIESGHCCSSGLSGNIRTSQNTAWKSSGLEEQNTLQCSVNPGKFTS